MINTVYTEDGIDILLVICNTLLPTKTMKMFHDDFVKQLETKVVVVPAYLEPEIINVPDGIEVIVKTCEDSDPKFLDKKLRFPKNQIDI